AALQCAALSAAGRRGGRVLESRTKRAVQLAVDYCSCGSAPIASMVSAERIAWMVHLSSHGATPLLTKEGAWGGSDSGETFSSAYAQACGRYSVVHSAFRTRDSQKIGRRSFHIA